MDKIELMSLRFGLDEGTAPQISRELDSDNPYDLYWNCLKEEQCDIGC